MSHWSCRCCWYIWCCRFIASRELVSWALAALPELTALAIAEPPPRSIMKIENGSIATRALRAVGLLSVPEASASAPYRSLLRHGETVKTLHYAPDAAQ